MMAMPILIVVILSNIACVFVGAALTYRRQQGKDPTSLPDFDVRKVARMILGREPKSPEPPDADGIDGKDKPEFGRFDQSKLPGGSPRHRPQDKEPAHG